MVDVLALLLFDLCFLCCLNEFLKSIFLLYRSSSSSSGEPLCLCDPLLFIVFFSLDSNDIYGQGIVRHSTRGEASSMSSSTGIENPVHSFHSNLLTTALLLFLDLYDFQLF